MSWVKDIIGAIGDGLSDSDTYAKYKQGKRRSAAMEGFADDPLAAVRRLQEAGFADDAMDLYETHQTNEIKRAAAASTAQNRTVDNNRGLDTYVGGLLSSATPETLPEIKRIVGRLKETRGYDMPFEIPDVWDENQMAVLRNFGRTQANQVNLERTDILEGGRNSRLATQERGRNSRLETQERGRNSRLQTQEGGRNSRLRTQETGRNNRTTQTEEGKDRRNNGGRRAPPAMPPWPPTRVGDRAQGPGGLYVSRDGKTWEKAN